MAKHKNGRLAALTHHRRRLDEASYKTRRRALQLELLRLQTRLRDYDTPCRLAVVFEGVDAAGKGGAIRRLTGRLDPRGFRVYAIGEPDERERAHHYLWRFQRHMPPHGLVAVFDRSWYGRVLVERVEGLAPREAWQRAYDEINHFERTQTIDGLVLVKFWLQISKKEQLRRFEQRAADPFKEYKLTDEDWRNRERWTDYQAAAEEMFARTDHPHAPWTLVSGEDKPRARLTVLKTVVERLRAALPEHEPTP